MPRPCENDMSGGAPSGPVRTITIPGWLENSITGPPFSSRKNLVFRVRWGGKARVAKVFSGEFWDRAGTEYELLGLCRDAKIRAPRPLVLKDNVVIMTSLRGRPAFELLYVADVRVRASRAAILDGVAGWLARFHKAFRWERQRGDSIAKNFMCAGTGVAGFDFEESAEGDPLADVGQFCAHLLASGDCFTPPLFEAAGYFASRYRRHSGRDRSDELPEAVSNGLEHYARFRRDGALLRSWAKKIRGRGLKML